MFNLVLVSLLWALSFALIKTHISGLDSTALATVRNALALLVFLPFFRWKAVPVRYGVAFAAIGGIQFGLMYALYMAAFPLLQASEVVLFTVFTPIFVALIGAVLERRLSVRWLSAAVLAAVGTGVVFWQRADYGALWKGFLLVQASNVCFAFGQVAYKRLRPRLPEVRESAFFAWLMAGGFAATLACSFWAQVDWLAFFRAPSPEQWGVLVYLGVIASGVGFFLWNRGAVQVNTGTLAVFNNLKLPLGVGVALAYAWAFSGTLPDCETLVRLGVAGAILVLALCLCEGKSEAREMKISEGTGRE
jgi:drug/metabolite transporter (DMT)-like permease